MTQKKHSSNLLSRHSTEPITKSTWNYFKVRNIALSRILQTQWDHLGNWCQEWNITTPRFKINRWPCFPKRMFQSISGDSSKHSIVYYNSRSSISQQKVSPTINISHCFANQHIFPQSLHSHSHFSSNIDCNRNFSERILAPLQYSRQCNF